MALQTTSIPTGAATTFVKNGPGRAVSALVTTTGTGTGNLTVYDGNPGGSDLAVDGTNPLKVTSSTYTFLSSDVGRVVNVTGGSGFTTGAYQVTSVVSGAAFLAASPAAASSTGGVFNLVGTVVGLVAANASAGTAVDFGRYGFPYSHSLRVKNVANGPVITLVYE